MSSAILIINQLKKEQIPYSVMIKFEALSVIIYIFKIYL